jgi:Domain of unknown function (DUF4129)
VRTWNEFVAALADLLPGGVPTLALLSVLATALLALAWYFWPHWLPWNWNIRFGSRSGRSRSDRGARSGRRFRFGRLRWRWRLRWRRRKRRQADPLADLPPDELPDLPAEMLALTADQLAAAGRFAEAVRERMRAIVRELIERGLIPPSPGWTVRELTAGAIAKAPAVAPPLRGAVDVFSEIWYGMRPARIDDDLAMRGYAEAVRSVVAVPVAAGGAS